jgi:hypothetical protein
MAEVLLCLQTDRVTNLAYERKSTHCHTHNHFLHIQNSFLKKHNKEKKPLDEET